MVAELAAAAVALFALLGELIHAARVRRIAPLAFGPNLRPAAWVAVTPLLRIGSFAALTWGLMTLAMLQPKVHKLAEVDDDEVRHIVLVLDVSPSMKLDDAGPDKKQSRQQRAADLVESFFDRVPVQQCRVSVVATYTEAKEVVLDTKDFEVVRNIMTDLPMHHAFTSGETKLFAGLERAAEIAKPWNPNSANVLVISDGDTVPAKGMPKMPASVSKMLIVGVGDPQKGKFINGRNSRQDVSTLRQIATRQQGIYHNGNEKHISSDTIRLLTQSGETSPLDQLSRREYALMAVGAGAAILALLPLLLHVAGTTWRPGVRRPKTLTIQYERQTQKN